MGHFWAGSLELLKLILKFKLLFLLATLYSIASFSKQAERGFAAASVFLWGGWKEGVGGCLWSRKLITAPRGLRIYIEEINPPQANKITH